MSFLVWASYSQKDMLRTLTNRVVLLPNCHNTRNKSFTFARNRMYAFKRRWRLKPACEKQLLRRKWMHELAIRSSSTVTIRTQLQRMAKLRSCTYSQPYKKGIEGSDTVTKTNSSQPIGLWSFSHHGMPTPFSMQHSFLTYLIQGR